MTNKGILFDYILSFFYSIAKAVFEGVDMTKYQRIIQFMKENPVLEDVISAFGRGKTPEQYYILAGHKKTEKD